MTPRMNAIAALLAAGLLSACGKATDSTAEALAAQAAVEIPSAQDVAGGRDGSVAGTGAPVAIEVLPASGEALPLPADFPNDVVLPADYTVVSVMKMGPASSVVLRSDESIAHLFQRYQAGLADKGWKETVSMQGSEGSMLGFEKDKRGVLVNLRSDVQGHTVISLSLQAP